MSVKSNDRYSVDEIKDKSVEYIMKGLNNPNIHIAESFIEVICMRQSEFECPLLSLLVNADDEYRVTGILGHNDNLHYAVLLLTQFQTFAACDAIINIFNLDEEDNYIYWGDYTTEYLNSILYRVCYGDFEKLKSVLFSGDDTLIYIRAAAYDALIMAYIDGHITREEIVSISSNLINRGSQDDELISSCMCEMIGINLHEIKDRITQAYIELSLIDFGYLNEKDIEEISNLRKYNNCNKAQYTRGINYFADTLEFLRTGHFYTNSKKNSSQICVSYENHNKKLDKASQKKKKKAKKAKVSKRKNRKK